MGPHTGSSTSERDVIEDESNGFGGSQDPRLGVSSLKKERTLSISISSVTETGSSSEEPVSTSGSEEENELVDHVDMEDESNGFGGAQDPRHSVGSFKKERNLSISSVTETGSSSEEPVSASASESDDNERDPVDINKEASLASFQSTQELNKGGGSVNSDRDMGIDGSNDNIATVVGTPRKEKIFDVEDTASPTSDGSVDSDTTPPTSGGSVDREMDDSDDSIGTPPKEKRPDAKEDLDTTSPTSVMMPGGISSSEERQSSGESSSSATEKSSPNGTSNTRSNRKTLEHKDGPNAYKGEGDHPEPLQNDSETAQTVPNNQKTLQCKDSPDAFKEDHPGALMDDSETTQTSPNSKNNNSSSRKTLEPKDSPYACKGDHPEPLKDDGLEPTQTNPNNRKSLQCKDSSDPYKGNHPEPLQDDLETAQTNHNNRKTLQRKDSPAADNRDHPMPLQDDLETTQTDPNNHHKALQTMGSVEDHPKPLQDNLETNQMNPSNSETLQCKGSLEDHFKPIEDAAETILMNPNNRKPLQRKDRLEDHPKPLQDDPETTQTNPNDSKLLKGKDSLDACKGDHPEPIEDDSELPTQMNPSNRETLHPKGHPKGSLEDHLEPLHDDSETIQMNLNNRKPLQCKDSFEDHPKPLQDDSETTQMNPNNGKPRQRKDSLEDRSEPLQDDLETTQTNPSNSETVQGKDSPDTCKRDHPEPLEDDSELPTQIEYRQLVPCNSNNKEFPDEEEEEELIILSKDDPLHPPPKRRPSVSRRDSSQCLFVEKQLDPEEEERRRNEVQRAMEILEHMRRANLVMEFGPGVNLEACVFCLREQRKEENATEGQLFKKKKKKSQHSLGSFLPKIRHEKQCIICHSPVCKKHWDDGFLHQQNVILCQDCAPLFDLDNLVECMNLNAASASCAESQKAQQEQHMRRLLVLYDRALLALRHSSQSFDDNARSQLVQTKWHKEGMGIGSHVTNIASGVTGIAATAVFMTPMGPWLLLTSLALGGVATAVGSGSHFVERMCPSTRQAEQTIALASMVDSLLEATTILRQAQITGALPPAALDDDDTTVADEEDDCTEIKRITQGEGGLGGSSRSNMTLDMDSSQSSIKPGDQLLFLEEDKDQRLMITILKAKKDREERPKNPIQFVSKHIGKIGKERAEEKERRRKREQVNRGGGTDDRSDQEQPQKGPLKRVGFFVGRGLNRAKDTTVQAVSVARTATTLAAVGMQAGGGGLVRRVARGARGRKKDEKEIAGKDGGSTEKEGHSKQGKVKGKGARPNVMGRTVFTARHGLGMFAHGFFHAAAGGTGQGGENSSNELESEEHKNGKSVATSTIPPEPSMPRMHFPFEGMFVRIFARSPEDAKQGAVLAELRHRNIHMRLRASGRVTKVLNRVQKARKRRKDSKNSRKSLDASEAEADDLGAVSSEDHRVFVKNARFLVKASLTVLRETARYAGGAFSAAIVCVETLELKEKVDRIRSKNGLECSNADKLDRLKQHVWEKNGGFPDSVTLEWELFANPQGSIPDFNNGKRSFARGAQHTPKDDDSVTVAPHWSSCWVGERPDGSQANLPTINDAISDNQATFASKASSACYPAF